MALWLEFEDTGKYLDCSKSQTVALFCFLIAYFHYLNKSLFQRTGTKRNTFEQNIHIQLILKANIVY